MGHRFPRVIAWPLLLLLVAVLDSGHVVAVGPVAGAYEVHISWSATNLLSGRLTDCEDINAASCQGGIASAAAHIRARRRAGETHIFVPWFDRQTPFVQMHPLQWGVNTAAFDYFGLPVYLCAPSLFSPGQRPVQPIVNGTARPLLTNADVPPTSEFASFRRNLWVDATTGVCLLSAVVYPQPNLVDSLTSTVAMLKTARRDRRTRTVVVAYDGDASVQTWLDQLARAVAADSNTSYDLWMPDVVMSRDVLATSVIARNGTQLVQIGQPDDAVVSFAVRFNVPNGAETALVPELRRATVTQVMSPSSTSIEPLTAADRDAQFASDLAYMRDLARAAAVNDPIVGQQVGEPMPFVRNSTLRMCMAGECPLGNLYADSYRMPFDSDIAFLSSGGIRGLGWPVGPIRVSDIWSSLPFANTLCHGTARGVTLWELLNASVSLATFEGEFTSLGDRLLQLSGMRVRYSTVLGSAGGPSARLVAITVLNRATGLYEPLDRLKLYTFATDSFHCCCFSLTATFLNRKQFPGETVTATDVLVQNNLASFMTLQQNTTAQRDGRLVNDTDAAASEADAFVFVQTPAGCAANTYWDAVMFTCDNCRDGFVAPAGGASDCTAVAPEATGGLGTTGTVVLAVVIPVVLVACIVALVVLLRTQQKLTEQVRDIAHAPREGSVTLLFTDIQDSTKLWSTCPMSMSVALDTHHAVIRQAISDHAAYEVKSVGDAFMIAVSHPKSALKLALQIQRDLLNSEYPTAINDVYAADEDEALDAIDDDPDHVTARSPSAAWHGLRVRVGMHTGEPNVQFDEVAKGYDYYGPPVNIAARTEGVGRGGQICATSTAVTACDNSFAGSGHEDLRTEYVSTRLGEFELKGVAEPVEIFQIVPRELSDLRKFDPPKIAPVGYSGDAIDVDDDTASHVTDVAHAAEIQEHAVFFTTMLKAVPPGERDSLREKIIRAWRVQHRANVDAMIFVLARRIFAASSRERARAVGQSMAHLAEVSMIGGRGDLGLLPVEGGKPTSARKPSASSAAQSIPRIPSWSVGSASGRELMEDSARENKIQVVEVATSSNNNDDDGAETRNVGRERGDTTETATPSLDAVAFSAN